MPKKTAKHPAKPKRGKKLEIEEPGVLYGRYSSHNQKDISVEQQFEKGYELAAEYGIRIIDTYADRAVSGRTDKRKDFQRMMSEAAKGKFRYVIAWKSNRMGRNMLEALINEARLQELGVRVLYVEEDFDDTAAGRFAARSMMNVNQFYSENMAEDIKRGLYDNASNCMVANGHLPYGYKRDETLHYVIDEPKAAVIREIFTRVAAGEPFVDIMNSLNARGIKTSYNRPWGRSSFQKILSNERYRGIYIYGDVRKEDGIPRIISDELFFKVQEVITTKKNPQGRHRVNGDYLLTGKLFCGKCKSPMVGISGTGRSGKLHYYYVCQKHRTEKTCDKKNVRRDEIELQVAQAIKDYALKDDVIEWIADSTVAYNERKEAESKVGILEDQLAGTERGIKNIMSAIEQGIITETTKSRLVELESERATIKAKIAAARADIVTVSRDDIISGLEMFRDGDVYDKKYQARLFDTFLVAVYVYDDDLRLVFSFSGNKNTIQIPIESAVNAVENNAAECSFKLCSAPPQESDRFYNRSLFHFFPFPGVHVLMSKFVKRCIGFVQKETILCIAIALALIFSMIVPPNLSYIAYVDWDTLFLLFSLMAVTKGFQKAGLFLYLGNHLIKRATTSRKMLFSLVFLPFISSMVITNDVSLLIFVPFGLTVLQMANQESLIVPLVVMQTVAANLGSMLTPMGNPQNLYLYTKFNLHFGQLCQLMLPYVLLSALCLTLLILFRRSTSVPMSFSPAKPPDPKCFLCSSVGFSLCLLGIFQTIPPILIALCIFIFLFFTDKSVLADLDYSLLGTFFALFIFIGNLGCIGDFQTFLASLLTNHVAPVAMLTSQVISNVPTALLLSGFTSQWQALMIGCNLGGLGSLIASMASLISYKVVAKEYPDQRKKYLLCFMVCNLCLGGLLLLACFLMNHLHLL